MSDSTQPELVFPCQFPLSVIGNDEDDFASFVIEIVCRHVPDLDATSFTTRPSSGNKYLSVSTNFTAESRAQMDALYRELSSHKRILTIL